MLNTPPLVKKLMPQYHWIDIILGQRLFLPFIHLRSTIIFTNHHSKHIWWHCRIFALRLKSQPENLRDDTCTHSCKTSVGAVHVYDIILWLIRHHITLNGLLLSLLCPITCMFWKDIAAVAHHLLCNNIRFSLFVHERDCRSKFCSEINSQDLLSSTKTCR